ncbi:MAG: hypothetical protein R3F11_02140 [Verrucomicrobiales bacterium]
MFCPSHVVAQAIILPELSRTKLTSSTDRGIGFGMVVRMIGGPGSPFCNKIDGLCGKPPHEDIRKAARIEPRAAGKLRPRRRQERRPAEGAGTPNRKDRRVRRRAQPHLTGPQHDLRDRRSPRKRSDVRGAAVAQTRRHRDLAQLIERAGRQRGRPHAIA